MFIKGANMIIDVTGIELTPGNFGKDCLGNGFHVDEKGKNIECCCDECDYMRCCFETPTMKECGACNDRECPHSKYNPEGESTGAECHLKRD